MRVTPPNGGGSPGPDSQKLGAQERMSKFLSANTLGGN